MKRKFAGFLKSEKGAFGVKEIAITVAVIVVIGAIVTIIRTDFLEDWIEDVWKYLFERVKDITGGGSSGF